MLKHNQVYKMVRLIFGSTVVDLSNVVCWLMEDCTVFADYVPEKQSMPIVTFDLTTEMEIVLNKDGLLVLSVKNP